MSGGRLCPRCSTLIESGSAIFCYNCGQELANIPEVTLPDQPSSTPPLVSSSKPKPTQSLLPLLALLTLILAIVFFLSFYFLWWARLSRVNLLLPSINEFVATVSALPQAPFSFGQSRFAALAPAKVELYLEGGNLRSFLSHLLSASALDDLSERVGLSLEETTSFFEPDFAFLKMASASALIAVNRDPEFVRGRIEKFKSQKKLDNLHVDLLGDYLVVSDDEIFWEDIREAFEKKQLSLILTSKYLETIKSLPTSGQVLIYGTNFESRIPGLQIFFGPTLTQSARTLRGNGLVVDNRSGSVVLIGPYD